MREESFDHLMARIRACRICEAHLPLGPRPVLQASPSARLLIVSQAPGRKVHDTGIPFNDPSGNRLRDWLGLDKATFYDPAQVAIVPMGFCFPGTGKSGDLPPRPECAPQWHPQLFPRLTALRLTLAIGQYAQVGLLKEACAKTLTANVEAWRIHLNTRRILPLPHPSPRNRLWLTRHPWFEAELLPELRQQVALALKPDSD
ncbi:MAG: uracil-DNA glycosylase family protein [Thermomonas sp.]|jgi:uracil-DNA glycosylase|uniref:uracil-DNA glycosylase family protein n=1 Tax=Thermomonas sp. TaxID=1971895 RepID=UPI001EC4BA75|nr:uracil-DNA glycosylase family protein [Thermomonas sp.]MBV2209688.1 uracil-DNA glycosylase family protein [Thermomonas sp.]